jgi:hypothetical protein
MWNDDAAPQYLVEKFMVRPGNRHEFMALPLQSLHNITAVL